MKLPDLIPDWKQAHRLWCVRICLGAIGAGIVAGAAVYNSLADYWPPLIVIAIATFTFACVVVARVLQQPPPKQRGDDENWEHA